MIADRMAARRTGDICGRTAWRVSAKIATIPEENSDIRSVIRNRFRREFTICAVWCAAIIVLSYIFGYYGDIANAIVEGRFRDSLLAVIILVVCALPAMMMRFWKWFSDCTFEGEIIDVRYVEQMEKKNPTSRAGGLIWVFRQFIKVKLDDGTVKKIKLRRVEGEFSPTYYKGERVRHYYGTELCYMQKLSKSDDEVIKKGICVMCGTQNEPGEYVCGVCGHSLPEHVERGLWG